jgi:glucan phosphoethanolaminetransferase (alkaline phosphatase superfamily)
MEQLGVAIGGFFSAFAKAPVLTTLLVVTWFIFPFAAASVLFPSDVIGFQDWMQGVPVRRYFTQQSLLAGLMTALVVIALMAIIQLNLTTLIYRKVNKFATFWPFAILLIAGIANGIWWLRTGYFDFTGALIGCTPFLTAIAWQMVCEKLGGRFVFGPGYRSWSGG